MGEKEHGLLQMAVGIWVYQHKDQWSLTPIPEMRLRIDEFRYRVADLAVVRSDAPDESVLTIAPLIVIEILPTEDRVSRYKSRLDDHRQMGVQNIWVLVPLKREAHDCSSGAWLPARRLVVPGTSIYLTFDELPIL